MSKNKTPRLGSEWLWIGLLGLVFLLGFWWFPGEEGSSRDTFSTSREGKKAFYLLVDRALCSSRRHTGLLVSALENTEVLCLLGPARYPSVAEWEALYKWVREGGRLLFALRPGESSADLGPFRVRVEDAGEDEDDDKDENEDEDENGENDDGEKDDDERQKIQDLFRRPSLHFEEATSSLALGRFRWHTKSRLQLQRRHEVLVSSGGVPQVVRLAAGQGTIVVSTSDVVFTNDELAREDHDSALLAVEILRALGDSTSIVFDESLNISGTPKVFGILFDTRVRPVTLQIILCVLLFGWWGSRRFGPPRRAEASSRRSIREHALALGNVYYKAGAGAHAMRQYLEFFRREVVSRRLALQQEGGIASSRTGRIARSIARAASLEEGEVRRVLERAESASRMNKLSAADLARIIRSLAGIREKLDQGKGDRHGA